MTFIVDTEGFHWSSLVWIELPASKEGILDSLIGLSICGAREEKGVVSLKLSAVSHIKLAVLIKNGKFSLAMCKRH